LNDALKSSLTLLPSTGKADLRSLADLGIAVHPENRNPATRPDDEFHYVDLSSVLFNSFDGVKILKGRDAPSRARRVIREGDVILSTVRPYLCGHAVVPSALHQQVCSTGFAVLRCPATVVPKFLYYMLISPQVIAQFHACMRGSHYPALKDDHVDSLLLPDLPVESQIEIVTKLDALSEEINERRSRIDAAVQRLTTEANTALPALLADVFGRDPVETN
jgi:type I restriction enzyme S subunit